MLSESVQRPPSDGVLAGDVGRPAAAEVLTSRNRSAGIDVVAELTRIAAALAGDGETSAEEIIAVADRIAELRTSLTFAGLVDGL